MDEPKTTDELLKEIAEEVSDVLVDFAPGGRFGPIEDPAEYDRLIDSLPQPQRGLKRELTNFARLLDYFGRANLKPPAGIADLMFAAAELPIPDRTVRVREINQILMKRLSDADQGAEFRV